MNVAKPPPSPQSAQLPASFELLVQSGINLQQPALQQLQNARHGGEHRDPLLPNPADKLRRHQSVLKMDFSRQQRRNPESHKLPEHVAKRESVENADRMYEAFPLQILPDFI